jgi:leucyl-tRNA synthetase
MKYNTAVSSLMTLLNQYEKEDHITRADIKVFVTLLNPIAPHITEEINERLGLGKPLCNDTWPTYDEAKIVDEQFEMIIQVNGKLRGRELVDINITEDEMKDVALKNQTISKYLEGMSVVKIITVHIS